MSRNYKTVNSGEYRDHSWQRVYRGSQDYHEEGDGDRIKSFNDDAPRRFPKSYETGNNSFYEIPHLPPPLEPKERLVPCIDPVTAELSVIPNWWKSKALGSRGGEARGFSPTFTSATSHSKREHDHGGVNNNYIMPSSLAPVFQASNPSPCNFIPPPTAYRDAINSSVKHPYHPYFSYSTEGEGPFRNRDSSCDIIEIKRPGTVCLHRNESDYGLAYQYTPILNYGGDRRSESSSSNQLNANVFGNYLSNQQVHFGSSGSGIFNLPEVYCPPPLAPISQQVSTSSSAAGSSQQLHGLMPSFFEKTKISNPNPRDNKQHEFQIRSPRHAYSEPILKSEIETNPFSNSLRTETTTRLSPRLRNKPFVLTNSSGCEMNTNCLAKGPIGSKIPSNCSDCDHRLLKHDANTHMENDSNYSELDENCRPKHDGSGDHHENAFGNPQGKLSNHNCLSPRARLNRLQPSVISPELTESLLSECLANLKSAHWEDNFEAFSQIYNLTEIHPGRVKSILNKVIWYGLPHLSSPRTKLARMACICFKRLFQTQKRSMETEGEKVFYRLLDLCGGLANNFIQQESRDALVAAVENMDPLKSMSFLELHGAKHKNPHVREFSAYLLSAIMDELPQNKLMNKEFSPRIIPMIVSFLREGLLQTRLHAKLALDKIFDHPTFESKLRRYVSPENVRHIAETLREFRERRSGHV